MTSITRSFTRAADTAADHLQASADHLSQMSQLAPSAFSRAAAQMDELTQRSMDRAREATHQVRDQAHRASDRAVGYIQHEPVKSMLFAVAAGAAVAMLAGWLARSRGARF
jgi:ElaB/YqjD/DUF883 family membrane-anchored ribosome-binding protein